mmetsp:Transcript_25852/g.73888  ORF Transcript_25852/g.73888 Transcript_25852/m.73888 type:complete len:219 (-) Transcript_25852:2774-3430(-)
MTVLAVLPSVFAARLGLPPVVHWLTWLAKRREQRDSWLFASSGPTFTAISVLPWPLRQGSIRCVSFELRNGMCDRPSALARKTSARLDKLRLMFCVSLSRSPTAPERSRRSEPARSTRCRAPRSSEFSSWFEPDRYNAKMECDRDETEFMSVLPTARSLEALVVRALMCSMDETCTQVIFVTIMPQSASCLMVWHCGVELVLPFGPGSSRSRSRMTSL